MNVCHDWLCYECLSWLSMCKVWIQFLQVSLSHLQTDGIQPVTWLGTLSPREIWDTDELAVDNSIKISQTLKLFGRIFEGNFGCRLWWFQLPTCDLQNCVSKCLVVVDSTAPGVTVWQSTVTCHVTDVTHSHTIPRKFYSACKQRIEKI